MNITDMDRRVVRLPRRPDDCVRVAPGTDLRDVPGPSRRQSVTGLLRERHHEEPIALGVFGWAMVVLLACAVLGLALLGG